MATERQNMFLRALGLNPRVDLEELSKAEASGWIDGKIRRVRHARTERLAPRGLARPDHNLRNLRPGALHERPRVAHVP